MLQSALQASFFNGTSVIKSHYKRLHPPLPKLWTGPASGHLQGVGISHMLTKADIEEEVEEQAFLAAVLYGRPPNESVRV